MTEPDPPRETRTERTTIVTDGDGTGVGTIIGVILAILAVILIGWLVFGMDGDDADVAPDEVDITVDVEGTGGNGEEATPTTSADDTADTAAPDTTGG